MTGVYLVLGGYLFIAQYCTTICITSYFHCIALIKFKHFPQNSRDILVACPLNVGMIETQVSPRLLFSRMTCTIEAYLWSRHAANPRAVNLKFVALPSAFLEHLSCQTCIFDHW